MTHFLNDDILDIVCVITKGELYGCQTDKEEKHKEQAKEKSAE